MAGGGGEKYLSRPSGRAGTPASDPCWQVIGPCPTVNTPQQAAAFAIAAAAAAVMATLFVGEKDRLWLQERFPRWMTTESPGPIQGLTALIRRTAQPWPTLSCAEMDEEEASPFRELASISYRPPLLIISSGTS